jgi:Na+/citrate or Na+/malate symporter
MFSIPKVKRAKTSYGNNTTQFKLKNNLNLIPYDKILSAADNYLFIMANIFTGEIISNEIFGKIFKYYPPEINITHGE